MNIAPGIVFRLDCAAPGVRLGATPIEVTPEGFKVYEGLAAFGDVVLDYPEHGRSEYVPAAEALAPEIAATLVGKPFTIHHPEDLLEAADPDGVKEHAEGTVRRAWADTTKSPPELRVEVVVWTAPAQKAIESGEVVELSPGYRCAEEPAPPGAVGPGGKPYARIQRRRQYNHLSGVLQARSEAPDGRRARLDEAAPVASYALSDAPTLTAQPAPAEDPAMTDITLKPDMDPAEALARFSPEGAEILKTLPPADMEVLLALALGAKAEEAEHAVEAEGIAAGEAAEAAALDPLAGDAVEIEIEGGEEEGEGGEGVAEEKPAKAAKPEGDAMVPQASQALTADMFAAGMQDMCDRLLAGMRDMYGSKADAPPPAPAAANKPAEADKPKADASRLPGTGGDASRLTSANVARVDRAAIEAQVRGEMSFVAEVAKRSGARLDGIDAATAKAVAMVKDHAPGLAALAEKAAAEGRRDDLLALFADADDRRRDALVGSQFDALRLVAEQDDPFRVDHDPRTAGGADNLPLFIDLTGAARKAT